jgi:hypothetical protein
MVRPPNNLSPESQPWARDIEKNQDQAKIDLASLDSDNTAAFKGINSSLGSLGGQITTLTAQQATLATLVNTQISLASNSQSSSNMAFANTMTVYNSYTFAVPVGYNWATFFITGSGRCLNNTASSVYFFLQSRMDSTTGSWWQGGTQQILLTAGQQGTLSAGLAATIDVIGGASCTVSISASTTNPTTAYSGNYVGFDGVLMFTK